MKIRSKICVNEQCLDATELRSKWTWAFKYCPYCGHKLKRRIVEPVTINLIRIKNKTK